MFIVLETAVYYNLGGRWQHYFHDSTSRLQRQRWSSSQEVWSRLSWRCWQQTAWVAARWCSWYCWNRVCVVFLYSTSICIKVVESFVVHVGPLDGTIKLQI